MRRILHFSLLLGFCVLYAEEGPQRSFVPAGAPFYTPDTGWGGAVYLIYCEDPSSQDEKTGVVSSYATATQNLQFSAGIQPELYFCEGRVRCAGFFEASRFPGTSWGTGPETQDSGAKSYVPASVICENSFLLKTSQNMYAGPVLNYRYSQIEDSPIAGPVEGGFFGMGGEIFYDTRENPFMPEKGVYVDIKGSLYTRLPGGDYQFSTLESDIRYFVSLGRMGTIAFQTLAVQTSGDVPFESYAKIGGSMVLRGYENGRYRDKASLCVQTEYRFSLSDKFGAVLFLGAGNVGPTVPSCITKDFKTAGGGGLRLFLDREKGIAARLDAGISEEGSVGVYFLVKEAF